MRTYIENTSVLEDFEKRDISLSLLRNINEQPEEEKILESENFIFYPHNYQTFIKFMPYDITIQESKSATFQAEKLDLLPYFVSADATTISVVGFKVFIGQEISLFDKFETKYYLVNKEDIFRFLNNREDLIKVLLNGYEKIKQIIYGDFNEILIEYDCDPEDGSEGLFIIIKTCAEVEKALNYLNMLEEKWFFKIDNNIIQNVFISVMPL